MGPTRERMKKENSDKKSQDIVSSIQGKISEADGSEGQLSEAAGTIVQKVPVQSQKKPEVSKVSKVQRSKWPKFK